MHLPEGYRLEVERIESRRIAEQVSATETVDNGVSAGSRSAGLALAFPGGITVNGRIDRIDRLNERECIIVDYKSGKTKNVERFAKARSSFRDRCMRWRFAKASASKPSL